MTQPTILASAPNGAYKSKADHPQVPLSLEEIVNSAAAAQAVGTSMLHLHVRDAQGKHTLDADTYHRTLDAIEDKCGSDLLLQITSEAGGIYDAQSQIDAIKAAKPSFVSIALREIYRDAAHEALIEPTFDWLNSQNSAHQIILYHPDDARQLLSFIEQQKITDSPLLSVLFVLGRYSDEASHPKQIQPFLDVFTELNAEPPTWMCCAFGPPELDCTLSAARLGGHARIGFENNLLMKNQSLAKNNAALLQQFSTQARSEQLNLASAEEAKQLFGVV